MEATPLIITHTIAHDEAEGMMRDIEFLARNVYNSSTVISADVLFGWYQRNPSLWWLAKINNRLIGYIYVIPLKKDTFQKTLQLGFDEKLDIIDDAIRNWNDGQSNQYSLYLCSSVVDPLYQKSFVLPIHLLLVQNLLKTLVFYGKSGTIMTEWSAFAVSRVGCHIAQEYYDMTCLARDNHNNSIFYGITNCEHQEVLLQNIQRKLELRKLKI
ncbi:unnamed protein product [Rotaria magnacalcarata]|uniref:Uncharacterized protein n=1 Tax=Rotaria magnacalcarata TaxID=392030 RepID=A0A814WY86_9BILA|nr:unnamed protein product [Rotaria magnacalcarata]CAF1415271.1 unnamed protein product [Rotaria magnacalcarata]CAF2127540.1 unnamed protein product [Rotaria magnacalcarata]CAF3809309.1 unnamed protein product [Rotaria magnacalcarata]CAF4147949.1 unnamed protein product [Rotaria magnacalcarata]